MLNFRGVYFVLGDVCFFFKVMGIVGGSLDLWFGILRVPLSNNPFHKGILGIQTTWPQTTNLPNKLKHKQQLARSSLGFWYFHLLKKDCPGQNRMISVLFFINKIWPRQKMNEWNPWKGTISKEHRLPTSIFMGYVFKFSGEYVSKFLRE